ncbi:MAG: hypothetical protein ABSG15_11120, partial [FCB group bacterium]
MNKFYKKNNLLRFIIVICFTISPLSLSAQVQVQRLDIAPLNRAILYCSEVPKNFHSELSADKKKITIIFTNANVLDSSREFHGKGIIQDIYIQSFKKNLEISIILQDKRGYTIMPLFYSHALAIEVFQWDKIDESEDNYRSGLLALEDGLIPISKKYLQKSASLSNPDAISILALLNLQEGKVKEAIKNLSLSVKTDIKIPDVYAAVSQICNLKKMQKEADSYAEKFYRSTNLKSFPEVALSNLNAADTSGKDIDSAMKIFRDFAFKDTIKTIAIVDSLKKDTLKNNFKNIFKNENKNESKDNPIIQVLKSFLPKESVNLFIFAAVFILIIIIFIIYAYIRWRKQQLHNVKKETNNKFQREFIAAQGIRTAPGYASKAYQKTGDLAKPIINNKKIETTTKPDKSDELKKTISFEAQIDKIANKIEEANKIESQSNIISEESDDLNRKIKEIQSPISAKLELALHLQEEQNKIKLKNIETLNMDELAVNADKIDELAKKLGLEKGSIEIKSRINELGKNKNNLE